MNNQQYDKIVTEVRNLETDGRGLLKQVDVLRVLEGSR
jgi:hypothetical protein